MLFFEQGRGAHEAEHGRTISTEQWARTARAERFGVGVLPAGGADENTIRVPAFRPFEQRVLWLAVERVAFGDEAGDFELTVRPWLRMPFPR